MSKSLFFFISLVFAVNCWELIILAPVLNDQTIPVIAVMWAIMGIYWFRNRQGVLSLYNFNKYNIYLFWIIIGFALSIVSAYIFWAQDLLTGSIVNRGLIWYLYIPLLLYIQPSEKELIKAITYYAVAYVIVWVLQAVSPDPITTSLNDVIATGRYNGELGETDFGQPLVGFPLILILLYYKIQKFIVLPSARNFIPVFLLLILFFLFQNRSTLFFALTVFGYSIFKLRSRNKILLISNLLALLIGAYIYTAYYWSALFQETIEQINDPDYNRWKAFYFFVFNYSPHWVCNIIGNGFLSANEQGGKFIQDMMDQGYYQYDNGILGFWSQYGIIPIIVLYTVIFKILFQKSYPFYVKAIAAHILFVPIIFDFHTAETFIFILIIYFLAYYEEICKLSYRQITKVKV